MKNQNKITFLVVHYLNYKALKKCFDSILKYSPKSEIILIDNDDPPSLKKQIIKNYTMVKYVTKGVNVGFGSGINLGAKSASGDLLFILNEDTQITRNTVDNLKYEFRDREVGIVAPILKDDLGKIYKQLGYTELKPYQAIVALSFINKYFPNNPISSAYWGKNNISNPTIVDVVPGSALMIRKKVFKEVNGFDENFFLYFEESDLCKRVRAMGYKIIITPRAEIIHEWKGSTPDSTYIKKIFMRSRFYYFKKHYGVLWAYIVEFFARISKPYVFAVLMILSGLFILLV